MVSAWPGRRVDPGGLPGADEGDGLAEDRFEAAAGLGEPAEPFDELVDGGLFGGWSVVLSGQ